MRLLLVALCLLLAAPAARAGAIAGQDDRRFVAALALWLADDEAQALPAFAGLAAGGNRAAQLILGLIDRTVPIQGPWLAARERAERIALARAPGGLSGRSWLAEAAADEPLARLWIGRDAVTATPEEALGFNALGEARAARLALQAVAARQGGGFGAVAGDPRYPPEVRYLVWKEWAATPGGPARVAAEIAARPFGDPQVALFTGRGLPPGGLDAWLATASLAAPLRAVCTVCPQETAGCLRAAYRLVGDYPGLIELGTPSETLVPAGAWLASERGRLAPLRVATARGRFAYETAVTVAAESPCLAAALAAEVARFRG